MHATVITSGYTVPLIGVPQDATEEGCDRCNRQLHLTKIFLQPDGRFMCEPCQGISPITIQLANSSPWRLNKMYGQRVR